jgi:hypothetical protein
MKEKRKRMHGQFLRSLDDVLADKEQTYWQLKFGDIKGETESLIVAAQDQALGTNYFKKPKINVYCVWNMKKP